MSLLTTTNDRLLRRFARTGDASSLAMLFDRTAPELTRIAGWLAGNRNDAEDLLQRTFVSVIEARNNYDPTKRAMPWLIGILGNHAKKLKVQQGRRPVASSMASEANPAATAANAEFAAVVAQLRAELGAPYAEVLDLHLESCLNAKQIAERLGRPAGTVRSQLVRGLDLLRRRLPNGFVAGAMAATTTATASIAAVRLAVMEHVVASTEVSAVAVPLGIGATVMTKKLAVVIPALLLLVVGAVLLTNHSIAGSTPDPGAQTAEGALATKPLAEVLLPVSAVREPIRESVHEQPLVSTQPEPGFAALVVRLTWSHDGSPAAGVGLRTMPQPGTYAHQCNGLTNSEGEVVLRRIRPGRCWMTSVFTKLQVLDLVAGETRVLEAVALKKNHVRGKVVDENDMPVGDARIWLSDVATWRQGFEVARSDAQGRFELNLGSDHYLGARKAGHAPSLMPTRFEGDSREVTLRLLGPGGSVHGHVRDEEGNAIANAVVDVGLRGGWSVGGSSSLNHFVRPLPQRILTAKDGSFAVDGVEPGATNIKVWAPGYGMVSLGPRVEARGKVEVAILLPRAASVHGVVLNTADEPIVGASVVAGSSDTVRVRAVSGADGRFELHDLAPGPCALTATYDGEKGSTTLDLTAGQTTPWQAVLEDRRHVRGRVIGPDGKGLMGLRVGTTKPGFPSVSNEVPTDESGAFVLRSLEDVPLDVLVLLENTMLLRQSVEASFKEAELVLSLSESELPTAHISGRVVDSGGKPLRARFWLMSWKFGQGSPVTTDLDGMFNSSKLPVGTYDVQVVAEGYGQLSLGALTLKANERRLLPDVVMARAGFADIRFQAEKAPRSCVVKILREDGGLAIMVMAQGKVATSELPPGTYRAVADQGVDGTAAATFVVRSKERTAVNLFFVPTNKVNIECRGHGSITKEHRIHLIVRDLGGMLVNAAEFHCRYSKNLEAIAMSLRLAPGSYHLELRVSDGRSVTTGMVVTADELPTMVVDLPVR